MNSKYIIIITLSFGLLFSHGIVNAQFPHTLYGYVYYPDGTPAKNFSITVINHDRDEIVNNESRYIYKNENYYQVEVSSPGLGWENGEFIEVKIEKKDFTVWKGNATISINLGYPNQKLPDIFLSPPPPSIPKKPTGPSEAYIGKSYNFSTFSSDPSNFNISYGWDWNNDDAVDEWSNWLISGATCMMHHMWQEEGIYEIKVIAKNEYNITSKWSDVLVVVVEKDKVSPNTYLIKAPDGTIDYNTVTFEWSGEDDVTPTNKLLYSYILQGYSTKWSEWTYNTSVTFPSLPNGEYIFKVKAKDEAGNEDATPALYNFTINVSSEDISPPIINLSSSLPEELSGKVKFEWNVSDEDKNISISIYYSNDNGTKWHFIVKNITNATSYEWDTKKVKNGKYIIKICAEDSAGNIGCVRRSYIVNNQKIPGFQILVVFIGIMLVFLSKKYHRKRA